MKITAEQILDAIVKADEELELANGLYGLNRKDLSRVVIDGCVNFERVAEILNGENNAGS